MKRISNSRFPRPVTFCALAALVGATTSLSAQTVPIPKPAPKGRDGMQMSGPITTGATSTQPPDPVIPDPRRNVPANIFARLRAL